MTSIKITFSGDDVVPQQVPKSQNASHIRNKITLSYLKFAAMGFFLGTKNEFEPAVVNKPSVFEPLKFYCMYTINK